jgi:hypothetical protein
VLIVAQLSLAVMLLVLATLLVQALRNIADAPLGIDASKMLTARLELPAWRYSTPVALGEYQSQMLSRLIANSAIEQAAFRRAPAAAGRRADDRSGDRRTPSGPAGRSSVGCRDDSGRRLLRRGGHAADRRPRVQ